MLPADSLDHCFDFHPNKISEDPGVTMNTRSLITPSLIDEMYIGTICVKLKTVL